MQMKGVDVMVGSTRRGRTLARLGYCALALTLGIGLTACSADSSAPEESSSSSGDERIELITSVPASDPFFAVMAKAGKVAAEEYGIEVNYRSPATYTTTPEEQARLIDNAIATAPDGIVTTLPSEALVSHLNAASDKGIPLAVVNSGNELIDQTQALVYYGESALSAGQDMGRRLKAEGVTHVLCPTLPRGTVKTVDDRCDGLEDGIAPGKMTTTVIDPGDSIATRNRVQAAVQKDPSINGVISLGATVSAATLAAKEALGTRGEEIKWASFDLGEATLQGIIDGHYLFAEDQQQFLQVYNAIVTLILNSRYGFVPGTRIVNTSAPVVGVEEAERMLALSKDQIR